GSLAFVVTAEADGSPVEAALGVSVFDRAVSLRALADGHSGPAAGDFAPTPGSSDRFGSVTLDDINRLDLSEPIPEDLDLVAELILRGSDLSTNLFSSSNYGSTVETAFSEYFNKQMKPFKEAMDKWFKENNFDHPRDRTSFDRIALVNGLDLDEVLDPWDEKYYVKFGFKNDKDTIKIYSKGLDRKPGTNDDAMVLSLFYAYFDRTGKIIDEAIERYHERTGKFIRDRTTLLRELGENELKD